MKNKKQAIKIIILRLYAFWMLIVRKTIDLPAVKVKSTKPEMSEELRRFILPIEVWSANWTVHVFEWDT